MVSSFGRHVQSTFCAELFTFFHCRGKASSYLRTTTICNIYFVKSSSILALLFEIEWGGEGLGEFPTDSLEGVDIFSGLLKILWTVHEGQSTSGWDLYVHKCRVRRPDHTLLN